MNKKDLDILINTDLKRYGFTDRKKPTYFKKMKLYGFIYTSTMRKAKFYKDKNYKLRFLFSKVKLQYLSYLFGFQIEYTTVIGKGLYIGHFGRIIINSHAILGNNINLSPGITIGMTNRGKNKGVPTIGNDVWIGTNAVVVGGIRIGNDVMIAPNSFVNFDVPDHSIVIGNPGVIHYRKNASEYYIENKV